MDAMRPRALRRVPIRLYVNQLLEAVLRPGTTAVLSIFMDEVQVKQTRHAHARALACARSRMRACRGVRARADPCIRVRARVRCVFFVFLCARVREGRMRGRRCPPAHHLSLLISGAARSCGMRRSTSRSSSARASFGGPCSRTPCRSTGAVSNAGRCGAAAHARAASSPTGPARTHANQPPARTRTRARPRSAMAPCGRAAANQRTTESRERRCTQTLRSQRALHVSAVAAAVGRLLPAAADRSS
jgi:hypothetical protein